MLSSQQHQPRRQAVAQTALVILGLHLHHLLDHADPALGRAGVAHFFQYLGTYLVGQVTRAHTLSAEVTLLTHEAEQTLLRRLMLLPEVVETVVETLETHHLPAYAASLAQAFHAFYTQCRVITEDAALTSARLRLLEATKLVLARTLGLMGISAPEQM